jgi:hypothetical protein
MCREFFRNKSVELRVPRTIENYAAMEKKFSDTLEKLWDLMVDEDTCEIFYRLAQNLK